MPKRKNLSSFEKRRSNLSWRWVVLRGLAAILTLVLAGACGGSTAFGEPSTGTENGLTETPGGGVEFVASFGVVYRDPHGWWVVRVSFSATNNGSEPVQVSREGILANGMSVHASGGTFPEVAVILPGRSASGTVLWRSMEDGAPSGLSLSFGLWTGSVALSAVPAPPAPNVEIVSPIAGGLSLEVTGTGTTFRDVDDNTHIALLPVRIRNANAVTFEIPIAFITARSEAGSGTAWGEYGSLGDVVSLPAESTVEGTLAWYFGAELPAPREVTVLLGSEQDPVATATATLAPRETP